MQEKITIHWFRQDLRLSDNPALVNAVQAGRVLPLYILNDNNAGDCKLGGASRVWLHHSLQSLNQSLGGKLWVRRGDALSILQDLIARYDISGVYYNRCYEPHRIAQDTHIKKTLKNAGIDVRSTNGSLLWEPWDISKPDGTFYKVFTPFYRRGCLKAPPPRQPLPVPDNLAIFDGGDKGNIDDLDLLPPETIGGIPWHKAVMSDWQVGEKSAQQRLYAFIDSGLDGYDGGRDMLGLHHSSRLSPHLQFGELSPNQIWHAVRPVPMMLGNPSLEKHVDRFCSQLGWRDFSHAMLYYNPHMVTQNYQPKFDGYPWGEDHALLSKWQRGQTGIPIVDAGMRELWQTGTMHNRVRMVVASFLVKNLGQHWRWGEKWFWDTLLDASLANNVASWQWVAGCGADAAPYFRIFNPVTQGQRFDGAGEYTRRWVPELKNMPDKYLFNPWQAPNDILAGAGVILGDTYPHPIIDLKQSREKALAHYKNLS